MNRRKIEVLPEEDFAHGESPAQCNRLERKILEKKHDFNGNQHITQSPKHVNISLCYSLMLFPCSSVRILSCFNVKIKALLLS